MKYYSQNSEEVLKEIKTNASGLSLAEAEKRLESYGPNKNMVWIGKGLKLLFPGPKRSSSPAPGSFDVMGSP